jgi:phosphoribosylanthranilate isomerase
MTGMEAGEPSVSRTRVKICGITNASDRDLAVAAGADAVGLVAGVTVDTPREISIDAATDLAAGVPPFVTSVLVTMPGDAATVRERVERVQPDAVQVHTAEPGVARALADAPIGVVAAVDAESAEETLAAFGEAADALLVDSLSEAGGGGTGHTHDWERTRKRVVGLDVPVILAGGLTPANAADAVATVEPYGVDVATGVERDGGLKDHDAVRQFIRAAGRGVTTA